MDHFTRYAMAFITKDQKAKTIVCILYEQFISVFGAPAKLLSNQGGELHIYTSWRALLSIWHSKMQDYCIPCAMQWTGGKISPNSVQNDWKVGCRQEGSMGTTSPWTSAGLQQYLICCHRVLTPLPHVWEVTSPPSRLFLPHNWCKYKSPLCPHLCGRGAEVLQRGLCWGPAPIQQWSRQTEVQLW